MNRTWKRDRYGEYTAFVNQQDLRVRKYTLWGSVTAWQWWASGQPCGTKRTLAEAKAAAERSVSC